MTYKQPMIRKLTRRQAAAIALGSSAALAQTKTSTNPLPRSPEEELTAAQDQVKRTAEALAKFEVPIEIEPAFQFKAL